MHPSRPIVARASRGITLVEALIAVIVLSLGLLVVARLQRRSAA